jgi:hypothetical protein
MHYDPRIDLKPADGAIGGHATAAQGCYRDFAALARRIADRCGRGQRHSDGHEEGPRRPQEDGDRDDGWHTPIFGA